ncbi:MAG: hypothetical protein AAFV53_13645 [Myxococcota bacterium]
MALSPEEVASHIRKSGVVRWTNLARILVDGAQSCVDGREPDSVLGTPGGDAGEYLVALATIEQLTNNPIVDDEVPRVFRRFLGHFGRFYMHTDSKAMTTLAQSLTEDERFAYLGADTVKTEELVRNPGKHADALVPFLIDPKHVGCGHLKLALLYPNAYGVRKGLTEKVIETVFRELWAGADINYVVLQGGHAEGAVVQVTAGKSKHAYTRVPMVAPCRDHVQMFVAHPKVTEWMRNQMAEFLVEEEPLLRGVEGSEFANAVNSLATRQLDETLGHLAQDLPVYTALVTESGVVQIRK